MVDPDQAGRNAFAHKGACMWPGSPLTREPSSMDPEAVGNSRKVLASELSGKATVLARAEEIGLDFDDEAARKAVKR